MRSLVFFVVFALMAVFSASGCHPDSETGAAALQISFTTQAPTQGLRGVLSGLVDTIRVTVSDESGSLAQAAFDYEGMAGTVEGIPVGEGRDFLVEALIGTEVVYRGSVMDITIVSHLTVEVTVTLSPAYVQDVYPPSAVVDLAAQASGANVDLTWTATGDDAMVGQAGSYDLRWSASTIQGSNFDSATVVAGTPSPAASGSAETFSVSGLAGGQTYHFAIRVFDDDGNPSAVSNEAIATLQGGDEVAPAAVADLRIDGFTDSTVSLAWTAPGDDGNTGTPAQYDLRYSTDVIDDANFDAATPFAFPTQPGAAGQAESLTVTGLVAGQIYYFALKAADEIPNWSDLSNVVSETPADGTPPAAVALSVSDVQDTAVTLAWVSPGDDGNTGTAASYEIRYSLALIDAGNFASATLWASPPTPEVAGTSQQVSITGLATAVEHWFAMISLDDAGNPSDLSNVVSATPGEQDLIAPATVGDLSVQGQSGTSVTLTWTAPGDDGAAGNPVSAFDLRYAAAAIADDAAFNAATQFTWPGGTAIVAAGQTQTLEVTGLAGEQTYHFALKARDEQSNWSGLSNSIDGTTTDEIAPEDIDDLVVTDFGDDYVTVQWTAPGDNVDQGTATAYQVYYHDLSFVDPADATLWATPPDPPLVAGTTETLTIDGLTPGQDVFVQVRSSDEVPNTSGLSNEISQTLSCAACPVIDSVRPTAAPQGGLVSIDGSGFDAVQGANTLTFGAVDALVVSWSDTLILARVPVVSDVADVSLTTALGTVGSAFTVMPYIESVTPAQVDLVNLPTSITLAGSGFGAIQGPSTVQVVGAGTQPTVASWSDSSIDLDLPVGATGGAILVTVASADSNTPLLTIGPARTWSDPNLGVLATGANPSTNPRIAADGTGDMQVVWLETDGTNLQVQGAARVAGFWNLPLDISQSAVDSQVPELISVGPGAFEAAWLDGNAAIRNSGGFSDAWSVPASAADESGLAVDLGALPDGSLVAVWSAGDSLSVRYSIDDGVSGFGVAAELSATSGNTKAVAGVVDPTGNFHVVFVDGTNLVHYVFDGIAWDGPNTVAAITGTPADVTLDVAVELSGDLHVLFWDDGYYHSSFDATTWSMAAPLIGAAVVASGSIQLVIDPADVLHAVVEEDQSGVDFDIVHFELPPGGTWSAGETLTDMGGDARSPSLAVGPDLSVNVVWSEADFVYFSSWD